MEDQKPVETTKVPKSHPWLSRFWNEHGERIIFMGVASAFGIGFYHFTDMTGEGKTLLIAVATLCLNKARSPKNGKDTDNPPPSFR